MNPEDRVREVLRAAATLVDPATELGTRARATLPNATGLSLEGTELALREHVETSITDAQMIQLLGSVEPAPRVHVVASANVFVGAVRALALAFAAAPEVTLKPSRREPVFAALLAEALRESALAARFSLTMTLEAACGDHVHAYGSDATIALLADRLESGVRLHAHGHGFGVAVVARGDDAAADSLARDVVVFDQRGCASPRVAFVDGSEDDARAFARALAAALGRFEREVPTGRVAPDEHAAVRAYLDAQTMAGEVFGRVGLSLSGDVVLPPVPRVVHVARVTHAGDAIAPFARFVTVVGGDGDAADEVAGRCPGARRAPFGAMQKPPLDGPIDRRGLQDAQGGLR